jgi:hypothetical protein
MEEMEEYTYGERAVGLKFNPGGKSDVDKIKRLSADLIDELYRQMMQKDNIESKLQFQLAIRRIQEGQMWGVKGSTWE